MLSQELHRPTFQIDPFDELISFKEAASLPPYCREGKPASLSTLHRHAVVGAKNVKLPVIRTPTGLRTTADAVRWFIAQLNRGNPAYAEPSGGEEVANVA